VGLKRRLKAKALLVSKLILLSCVAILLLPSISHANRKYASLVIDSDTGVVIHQENAGDYRYPASLTKLMTLYLAFDALDRKKLTMSQKLRVSSRAAAQPASKLGLRRGQRISVRNTILSLVVKSANDSSVVIAEAIGGSEWQFVMMMNRMAKRLGMNHTHFRNSSGLHDRRQKTTAYDMARLAVAMKRDFGKYYHLFSRTKFFFNGRTYNTHNKILKKYRGSDGLKTGYVRASGFNVITSARRGSDRLVAIVMGGKTSRSRDKHMIKLLDRSFYKIAKKSSANKKLYARKAPNPIFKPITKPIERFADLIPAPKSKPKELDAMVDAALYGIKRQTPVLPKQNEEIKAQGKLVGGKFVPIPLLKPRKSSLGMTLSSTRI